MARFTVDSSSRAASLLRDDTNADPKGMYEGMFKDWFKKQFTQAAIPPVYGEFCQQYYASLHLTTACDAAPRSLEGRSTSVAQSKQECICVHWVTRTVRRRRCRGSLAAPKFVDNFSQISILPHTPFNLCRFANGIHKWCAHGYCASSGQFGRLCKLLGSKTTKNQNHVKLRIRLGCGFPRVCASFVKGNICYFVQLHS